MNCYRIFKTEFGWAAVIGKDGRVSRFEFPRLDRAEIESIVIGSGNTDLNASSNDFAAIVDQLCAYFAGERVDFQCELDFSAKGAFDIKVWEAARIIPYGDIVTYGTLAAQIGHPNAPRAVGQALGRNPVPVIVPCHRILRSDGKLGGFSAGLEWKIRLLGIENSSK
ncbi:MAG: methylated-DNA--[protein]-cysteine S-methyltransferase [Armatimonadota bacterium]